MTVGNTLAATLCYICAGNIDKTVEIWSRSLKSEHDGKTYVDLLQVVLFFWGKKKTFVSCYSISKRLTNSVLLPRI